MKLVYIGAGFVPGWPAQDHEEPDPALAQEKLATGLYRSESGAEKKEQHDALRDAKDAANVQAAAGAQAHADELKRLAEAATTRANEAADTAEEITADAQAAAEAAQARRSRLVAHGHTTPPGDRKGGK